MRVASLLLVILIGSVFVGGSVLIAYGAKKHIGRERWLAVAGGSLLVIGGLGFFGTALAAVGGLRWLGPTFEWPVGSVKGAVIMRGGSNVVPHTPTGRIQVYDHNWKFLRGWWVDAGGGTFVVRPLKEDQIEVITARKQMRYVYSIDGLIMNQGSYSPQKYSDFPSGRETVSVPTRWWLWSLTNPFRTWIVGAIGMAFMFLTKQKKNTKTKRITNSPPEQST